MNGVSGRMLGSEAQDVELGVAGAELAEFAETLPGATIVPVTGESAVMLHKASEGRPVRVVFHEAKYRAPGKATSSQSPPGAGIMRGSTLSAHSPVVLR